jgi:hypothetical protein
MSVLQFYLRILHPIIAKTGYARNRIFILDILYNGQGFLS